MHRIEDLREFARRRGVRNLLRVAITPYQRLQSLRLALFPIDFWRYAEFSYVLEAWEGSGPVIDLASPKALGGFMAANGAQVVSVDVHPLHAQELHVYREGNRPLSGIHASGIALPFADESFSFGFSVSVVEHIAGDGDRLAIGELARVLKPGSQLVVTVPVARKYEEIWHDTDTFGAQARDTDRGVFFCRLYDRDAFHERLLNIPSLEVESIEGVEVIDREWWERYQAATRSPRSLFAVARKLFDQSHARRQLASVNLQNAWVTNRGVAAITYRKQ